jgi:hypothetical protein
VSARRRDDDAVARLEIDVETELAQARRETLAGLGVVEMRTATGFDAKRGGAQQILGVGHPEVRQSGDDADVGLGMALRPLRDCARARRTRPFVECRDVGVTVGRERDHGETGGQHPGRIVGEDRV